MWLEWILRLVSLAISSYMAMKYGPEAGALTLAASASTLKTRQTKVVPRKQRMFPVESTPTSEDPTPTERTGSHKP